MNGDQFARYLERDKGRCCHCGTTEGLVPQHRVNRGMGGSKARHRPANVLVLCSYYNGLIESSSREARIAEAMGWKLKPWQDPGEYPAYDAVTRSWFWLDDDFGRKAANDEAQP